MLCLAGAPVALAQPPSAVCPIEALGCTTEGHDFLYRRAAFDDIALDTGWVPAGSPIQLRIALYIGGSTEVEMGTDLGVYWPGALATAVRGRPETGVLRINYGIELEVSLRFDITVAGIHYRWEGAIPVPGIPEDLRMAAEGMFDPLLLPPSMRPVSVSDDTDPVAVVRYDALGGLISIPGVGGGIALTLMGTLDASYQTERVVVSDAMPILAEDSFTLVGPDPGFVGYGRAKDLLIHPEGTLSHHGAIIVAPILYLSFAGTRRDYPLVEIPIPIVDTERDVIFDDAELHVPLPDIDVRPVAVELGPTSIGDLADTTVMVTNEGDAELLVTVRTPGAPFGVMPSTLALPPRTNALLTISYVPTMVDPSAGLIVLETNDPDEPEVIIRVRGETLAPPMPDAGMVDPDAGVALPIAPMDGGCGCRVVGVSVGRPAVRNDRRAPEHTGSALVLAGITLFATSLSRASRRRRRFG